MKNYKFTTREGVEVELNDTDMYRIHKHYEIQCTADYLRENHENWSEEKIQSIAIETRRQMFEYDYAEDEAIEIATKRYVDKYESDKEYIGD